MMRLHLAQLALHGIVAVLAVCVVGTAGHGLDVFGKQQGSNPWWLPLWPQHFDINGSRALIGSAVPALVLAAVFLGAAAAPQLAPRPTLRALLALGTAAPAALLTLITTIYAHMLNRGAPQTDTIQTWTCRYRDARPLPQDVAVPSGMDNANFGALCRESQFALYGTLVMFLALAAATALAVVTWLVDKRAARKERNAGKLVVGQRAFAGQRAGFGGHVRRP